MCGGKPGTGRGSQGKASFVKDGEGELIRFGCMIMTAKSRKSWILHLPTACPSSPALQPLWTGTVWGAELRPTSICDSVWYRHKSWEQFAVIPGIRASPVPLWSADTLAEQQRTCPDGAAIKASSSQTYSKYVKIHRAWL